MSNLEQIIEPEIVNDELYAWIEKLAANPGVKTILEIGSSSGEGSTQAFINGMLKNPSKPMLFCMEMVTTRFAALRHRWGGRPNVFLNQMSSVPDFCFMTPEEVTVFYNTVPTTLNRYPLEQVLGWLKQDLDYLRENNVVTNGIVRIKESMDIVHFDLALLDGSAFTGFAELQEVHGAKFIILDDIVDIKHFKSYENLSHDPAYFLLAENKTLRNGYAIFQRSES